VATFTQLGSGNWRVQVRRKIRYVAETFRRRKDGEEWALEMERNIDRNGSSKPRMVRNVRTFGDLIDLHDEDMREVGRPPRRSKAAVMASLKTELGSVKLPALNRERLIEFGRKRAKQGAGPATLAIDLSFIRTIITHAAAVHGIEVSAEEARLPYSPTYRRTQIFVVTASFGLIHRWQQFARRRSPQAFLLEIKHSGPKLLRPSVTGIIENG
jgi:hypothetical protein